MPANIRCFVAMAFDRPDTDAMFAVIRRTLKPLGIVPRRVDRIEHNDNIDQKNHLFVRIRWFRSSQQSNTAASSENTLDQRFKSR